MSPTWKRSFYSSPVAPCGTEDIWIIEMHLSKIGDIALKDLIHSLRNMFAVTMMLIVPLVITGLLYLAFGRNPGSSSSVQLSVTKVVIVNLDEPPSGASLAAGQQLVNLLSSSAISTLIQATQVSHKSEARQAVDNQQAGLAVIIPPDFTQTILKPGLHTSITLYQDPTLTIGPIIVSQIISQFLDGFNGAVITVAVTGQQMSQQGQQFNGSAAQQVATQFGQWAQANPQMDTPLTLDIQPLTPSGNSQSTSSFAGSIMIGMMIFFIFFTGAEEAQSIIREDEHKTLARLFATPTPRTVILAGKILSVFLILTVQIIVLLIVSALVFNIHWGNLYAIVLASLGTIAVAGGFGLFVMSLVKTTRQAGPLLGAVLTLTGVAGGTITTGFQNLPAFFNTLTLATPQGWALAAWKATLAGGGTSQLLMPVAVLVGLGLLFSVTGVVIFSKRFV